MNALRKKSRLMTLGRPISVPKHFMFDVYRKKL